jgi:hypothetical protein
LAALRGRLAEIGQECVVTAGLFAGDTFLNQVAVPATDILGLETANRPVSAWRAALGRPIR